MSFEIRKWDGLAKLGMYTTKSGKSFQTPALFPVVHPKLQEISADQLKEKIGFPQFITSAYLLSKNFELEKIESIHELLDTDSIVMMDSGAYQLMVYGDVDLTWQNTIELQKRVGTDIGVIMDHPIGATVPYKEAKKRVETTIERVQQSKTAFSPDSDVCWTLPIQGGKFLDLMDYYLDNVLTADNLTSYTFFALGSVVQLMINQDYTTLVKMIINARKRLPVTYPLHLFGAGHPAMLALSTFLGCDTFDSAAYSLMAKDGRYMTNFGTYQLNELDEFPCVCPVCAVTTPNELNKSKNRRTNLALHNLWVTQHEIREIRLAISRGGLWDLVMKRANSVPGLAKATKYVIHQLSRDEELRIRMMAGTPISKDYAIRLSQQLDLHKPEIQYTIEKLDEIITNYLEKDVVLLFLDKDATNFRRLPEKLLRDLNKTIARSTFIVSSIYGLVPITVNEIFPTSQFTSDLLEEELNLTIIHRHLKKLNAVVKNVIAICDNSWNSSEITKAIPSVTEIIESSSPFSDLLKITLKN